MAAVPPSSAAILAATVSLVGILQPGVEIAAGLQIEELPHVAAGSVFEGGALNDRHLPGFAAAGSIACLYAFGSDA